MKLCRCIQTNEALTVITFIWKIYQSKKLGNSQINSLKCSPLVIKCDMVHKEVHNKVNFSPKEKSACHSSDTRSYYLFPD